MVAMDGGSDGKEGEEKLDVGTGSDRSLEDGDEDEDDEENQRHARLRRELDELDRVEDELKRKLADLGNAKETDDVLQQGGERLSTSDRPVASKPSQRDRKMFNLLVGTLKRAKEDWSQFSSSDRQKKRTEAEERARERESEQRKNLLEKQRKVKEERIKKQAELKTLKERKNRLTSLYAEERRYRSKIALADQYLTTKTEPKITWRPRFHTDATRKLLEEGRAEAIGDAEERLQELQETIRQCKHELAESREILNDLRRGDSGIGVKNASDTQTKEDKVAKARLETNKDSGEADRKTPDNDADEKMGVMEQEKEATNKKQEQKGQVEKRRRTTDEADLSRGNKRRRDQVDRGDELGSDEGRKEDDEMEVDSLKTRSRQSKEEVPIDEKAVVGVIKSPPDETSGHKADSNMRDTDHSSADDMKEDIEEAIERETGRDAATKTKSHQVSGETTPVDVTNSDRASKFTVERKSDDNTEMQSLDEIADSAADKKNVDAPTNIISKDSATGQGEVEEKEIAEEVEGKKIAEEVKEKEIAEEVERKEITEEVEKKAITEEGKEKEITEEGKEKEITEEGKEKEITEEVEKNEITEEVDGKDNTSSKVGEILSRPAKVDDVAKDSIQVEKAVGEEANSTKQVSSEAVSRAEAPEAVEETATVTNAQPEAGKVNVKNDEADPQSATTAPAPEIVEDKISQKTPEKIAAETNTDERKKADSAEADAEKEVEDDGEAKLEEDAVGDKFSNLSSWTVKALRAELSLRGVKHSKIKQKKGLVSCLEDLIKSENSKA